jgi:tRNA pseudouridine55 synthase
MVRKGKDFKIKSRLCKIYSIKLLDFNYPRATFKAKVSSGTYIRSIANDL